VGRGDRVAPAEILAVDEDLARGRRCLVRACPQPFELGERPLQRVDRTPSGRDDCKIVPWSA
jgi:hypothetical protein